MKKIWLTKDPTIFVTPLTVGFLFYFMNYIGVVSILFNYTQGPPFSMNSAAYSILLGVRGVMSIIVSILLILVQDQFHILSYFPVLRVTPMTQILLTTLAPSLHWAFSMTLQYTEPKYEEGAKDVNNILVTVVRIFCGNFWKRRFELSDWVYASFGIAALVCQNLIYGLTKHGSLFYIGGVISSGSHIVIPVMRKLLSDRVDQKYYGALFAIPAWIECGGNAIGAMIYSGIKISSPTEFNSQFTVW